MSTHILFTSILASLHLAFNVCTYVCVCVCTSRVVTKERCNERDGSAQKPAKSSLKAQR